MTLPLIWLTGAAFTLLVNALIHATVHSAELIDEPYAWLGAVVIIGLFWPGVLALDVARVVRGYWEGRRGR